MSEQTANLCTTDACESLRARLAKYEDAEGRPVVVIPEQADELLIKWTDRALKAERELAALKAQPSGVVLPEPMKRGDEGGSGEYGAAMIRGYNACLREVARLNSSPVSAGEAFQCEHAACKSLGEHHPFCEYVTQVSAGGVDERE